MIYLCEINVPTKTDEIQLGSPTHFHRSVGKASSLVPRPTLGTYKFNFYLVTSTCIRIIRTKYGLWNWKEVRRTSLPGDNETP